ncbi:DUF222 domain-containing protein [Friedmanniella luteola]|uniref:DUF222 domain-containing protein n=1 Tax=Friedmanniella luteola TaxID=546871 RepID=UPI003CCA2A51
MLTQALRISPHGRPVQEPDQRRYGQRLHDTLEQVCGRVLRAGELPNSGGVPAAVVVTIDAEGLRTRTGCGTTSDGTRLSVRDVLALAGQAEVIPTVRAERCRPHPRPPPADRLADPDPGADRPRRRVRLPRLLAPARVLPTPPHHGVDRRRRDRPGRSHPGSAATTTTTSRAVAGPAGCPRTAGPRGCHPGRPLPLHRRGLTSPDGSAALWSGLSACCAVAG